MEIRSDTPTPLVFTVISNAPRAFNPPLMAFLMVFSSQLIAIGITHAHEQSESENNIVAQAEASARRANDEASTSKSTKERTITDANNEVHCLALNIYFEARSEPETGQRAVGHVVMNRVAHPRYPDSVCEVVRQGGEQIRHRCQFSWWCDGLSDKPVNQRAWDKSLRLAQKIYLGILKDTTNGALWYHAVYVQPYWSKILLQGDRIGQHIFYLENRRSRRSM